MAYEAERRQIDGALPIRFEGAFVAGGAVTSVFTGAKINDVDLYFKSRRAFERAVYDAYEEGLWCVAASKRAVTFADQSNNIAQLMYFDFFPAAEDIFKAFDFTVCMGAVDLDTGFFKSKSDRWWRKHGGQAPFPKTVLEFMERQNELLPTGEIVVKPNGKYWEVVDAMPGAANDNVTGAGNDNEPMSAGLAEILADDIPF